MTVSSFKPNAPYVSTSQSYPRQASLTDAEAIGTSAQALGLKLPPVRKNDGEFLDVADHVVVCQYPAVA